MSSAVKSLVSATAALYRSVGNGLYFFAHGKLRFDPVYLAIIKSGMSVLDLGCGPGLLFALLHSAQSQYRCGSWPDGWCAPAEQLRLHGVEFRDNEAMIARNTLRPFATIDCVDLDRGDVPRADVIVLLDVLHYLDADAQSNLIERISAAISPGGLLLIREADAAAGFSFRLTRAAEMFAAWWRGPGQGFHFRSRAQWNELLAKNGFVIETMPMSEGTPFSNLLWLARRVE